MQLILYSDLKKTIKWKNTFMPFSKLISRSFPKLLHIIFFCLILDNLGSFSKSLFIKLASFSGKRSVDQISVDRNCVLSLDRNYVNHLIEFHLNESVDRNFNNVILSYFKLSIKCQNP
jgi:hypothetical protein